MLEPAAITALGEAIEQPTPNGADMRIFCRWGPRLTGPGAEWLPGHAWVHIGAGELDQARALWPADPAGTGDKVLRAFLAAYSLPGAGPDDVAVLDLAIEPRA